MDKTANKPTIYFDLDGTLYDLYGVAGWLPRLLAADVTPYAEGNPLVDLAALNEVLIDLVNRGYGVGVISWVARGATREYAAAIRRVKRAWIRENLPTAAEVHIVKYGTPKHYIANDKHNAILVDDERENLTKWNHGATINANSDIIAALKGLN